MRGPTGPYAHQKLRGGVGLPRGGRSRRQQWIPRRSEAEKKRVDGDDALRLESIPSGSGFLTSRRFRGAAWPRSGRPQSTAVAGILWARVSVVGANERERERESMGGRRRRSTTSSPGLIPSPRARRQRESPHRRSTPRAVTRSCFQLEKTMAVF